MANTNFKFGPFKYAVTGVPTALAILLFLVFLAIAAVVTLLLIWLLFINIGILLVSFNFLNFVFAVLLSLALIGVVAGKD